MPAPFALLFSRTLLLKLESPQHDWNSIHCAPGATRDFTNCNKLDEILQRCNDLGNQNASQQQISDCFCTQEVLNAYVGCKNEAYLCLLTDTFDAYFDQQISDWHDICRPYLTSTPTTPAGVTLSTTYDVQDCETAYINCNKLGSTFTSCSTAYAETADLSSCLCASDVLALASACEIDGYSKCIRSTLAPSSLWAVRFCSTTPVVPVENPSTATSVVATKESTVTPLRTTTASSSPERHSTAPLTTPVRSRPPQLQRILLTDGAG
ncbi:hypothetical protein NW761_014941 [Fusarium oxysporum]|nr:hypothetical protein NW758_014984 [Fusarium oxysporum]KAJ4072427.1 hypothetical protein NW761_014941 [Fusarium oxysporum]